MPRLPATGRTELSKPELSSLSRGAVYLPRVSIRRRLREENVDAALQRLLFDRTPVMVRQQTYSIGINRRNP